LQHSSKTTGRFLRWNRSSFLNVKVKVRDVNDIDKIWTSKEYETTPARWQQYVSRTDT